MTYLQFRDYLNRRGLIYIHNPIRDSYVIYGNSRSVKPILIAEISARDAVHNFDQAKDQIEMAFSAVWVMKNHFRFRDYIVKMGLDYSFDDEKNVFTVYTWVKRGTDYLPVTIDEVSGIDVLNNYRKVKDRIDMAIALQEIVG